MVLDLNSPKEKSHLDLRVPDSSEKGGSKLGGSLTGEKGSKESRALTQDSKTVFLKWLESPVCASQNASLGPTWTRSLQRKPAFVHRHLGDNDDHS